MNYLQFDFVTDDRSSKEILIAFLAQYGFESFVEEENILKAFVKEQDFIEERLGDILSIVPATFIRTLILPQNWNAQWESSFEPIVVNDLVHGTPWAGIRANFHKPIPQVLHEIIITPKMSFGTGHHATTYLMIEQMANIDFKDKTVVDFGTGTGILSVLAEKMGASAIDAIDNDDWSIENAGENLIANHCSKIKLHKAVTISANNKYDIILANINLDVIQNNFSAILSVCKKGSFILLSGFLKADEKTMEVEFCKAGVRDFYTFQKGEWICILCKIN